MASFVRLGDAISLLHLPMWMLVHFGILYNSGRHHRGSECRVCLLDMIGDIFCLQAKNTSTRIVFTFNLLSLHVSYMLQCIFPAVGSLMTVFSDLFAACEWFDFFVRTYEARRLVVDVSCRNVGLLHRV